MNVSRRQVVMCISLAVISIGALLVCQLALMDIHRGEPNLEAEWLALRLGFICIAVCQVVALATFVRVLRRSE